MPDIMLDSVVFLVMAADAALLCERPNRPGTVRGKAGQCRLARVLSRRVDMSDIPTFVPDSML